MFTVSEWACLIGCILPLTLMSLDDWKDMTISESKCGVGWVSVVAVLAIFKPHIVIFLVVAALALLYLLCLELTWWGDADFIFVSMILASFCSSVDTLPVFYMYGATMLLCAIPYAKLYYRKQGSEYKFGSKLPVPMYPLFTVCWVATLIECLFYSKYALGFTILSV